MSSPLITVGIPTFERADLLLEAAESVLAQSFSGFELLVVDNASGDGTRAAAEGLARRDSRVRYVRNARNLGMSGNWLRVLELSRGRYLKFLMDDDLLLPGCLDAFAAAVTAHPEGALVACLSARFGAGAARAPAMERYAPSGVIPGAAMLRFLNAWSNQIGCPTNVMFRIDALPEVSRYWAGSTRRWGPDFLAYLVALQRGAFLCLNEPLVAVREHARSATANTAQRTMQEEEEEEYALAAEAAGGDARARSLAELHAARAAFVRFAGASRAASLREAMRFFRRWSESPQRWAAAAMAVQHSRGGVLLPAPVARWGSAFLGALRRARTGTAAVASGGALPYRYAGMAEFWASEGRRD